MGIGTVLADDPRLTARLPPGEGGEKGGDLNPQPIVLDPSLRTPPTCRLLNAQAFARGEQRKPWIVCGPRPDPERRKALEQAGATILPVVMEEGQGGGEGESRCLSIPAILTCLMDQGLKSIMVEGGAKVIRSFLQASDQVDALIVTIAPTLVGDQGVSAVASRSGQEKRVSRTLSLVGKRRRIVLLISSHLISLPPSSLIICRTSPPRWGKVGLKRSSTVSLGRMWSWQRSWARLNKVA